MRLVGAHRTVCPDCGYEWTLSIGVARSWSCPRCGHGRRAGSGFETRLCLCEHRYDQHRGMTDDPDLRPVALCSQCACDYYVPAVRRRYLKISVE